MKIIRELTPKEMYCSTGLCPAIFETDENSYVLIGKKIDADKLGIGKRVADDEVVVEVPRRLIDKSV